MTSDTPTRLGSCARLALMVLVCGVLASCAGTPMSLPAAPAPAPTPSPAPPPTPPTDDTTQRSTSSGTIAFEDHHRKAAEAASRRSQWAETLWALDVLLAIHPADSDLLKQRQQAQDAAQAAAQNKWLAARMAQAQGDDQGATRLYLEVLALTPQRIEAADALRQIEHDRVRRQHLGQLSRNVLTRRGIGTEAPPPNRVLAARRGSKGNDIEHASLLASQGDLVGAIQLIRPGATMDNPDPAARQLLVELYVRQAEGLAGTDKPAAIAALERAVQTDPRHTKAAARLKELRASLPTGTKTIPAKPWPAAKR